jgi:hypothetical protein
LVLLLDWAASPLQLPRWRCQSGLWVVRQDRRTRRAQMSTKKSSSTTTTAAKPAKTSSKTNTLIDLLKRDGGVTLEEMMAATGWQKHSVRGFMAGTLKKCGLTIRSEKTDKGRLYLIVDEAHS